MMKGMALLVVGSSLSLYAATGLAAVGRTPGQFAVSPMGSAQYSIPIWSPPGPHGVQPQIALTYDSQQGNGYVGVGWGVSGLSSIYRCNLTIAQDGAAAPIALATSDGYCMDGQRLRLTGGTYGTANSTYQTEVANFVNVVAYGSAGNGPAYWQATDRNGRQYTYGLGGTTSNAQVLASGSTTANSWQLNEVKDPAGNSMTITYSTTNVTGLVVPHVISWVPASAGSSSYNYTMTFAYGTTGSVYGYVGGTPFNNTNILSSIAIAYQGAAQKTYYLTYSKTTTASSRYLLTQVEECAGTGTSNCLAPTNVTWQAGAAGVGGATALGGTAGSVVSAAYDFNGDGRNDLVMLSSTGTVLIALGGPSGYGTAVSTGLSSSYGGPLIADIDGSGVATMVVAGSDGYWHYYKGWNGSAFAETGSSGIAVASFPSAVLADVDGDGRADLIYIGSDGYVHVRLNTSAGGTVSFSSTDIDSLILITTLSNPRNVSSRGLHFWGGAQQDVIGTYRFCTQYIKPNSTACSVYAYTTYALHFTGSTFDLEALSETTVDPLQIVDYADYNDDGCTDILTTTQLLLSTCNGNIATSVPLPSGATAVGGMDWNGDGRRDVLIAQSNGDLGVVLSTGSGLASTVTNTSYSTSATSYATAHNLTGDGQDGLIGWNGTSVTYYLHNSPNAPPDLLTSVADGYGNSANPSYVSIAQSNYTQYSDATYPYENYIGPRYVVSEALFSDASNAPGSTYNQTFWYYGAWVNLQGRGFQAFNEKRVIDSRNELYYSQYYERSFPETGMDYEDVLSNASGQQINEAQRTLAVTTLSDTQNQAQYFPFVSNLTTKQWEVGGTENGDLITTTSVNYTFDNYGNALTVDTTVTNNDTTPPYANDSWTTNITNTPDVDTTHWCLGLLTQTQVAYSASIGSPVTRTKTFTPDTTNCRYTQIVTEPNSAYTVTEAFTFDSFGNIATDTVTGANMPSSPASRMTSMNWGTTGQFLTSKTVPIGTVANPATATTTWSYASAQALTFGVPDSMTDPNATTTYRYYDGFGRKTKETRPDGTSTQWVWSLCAADCGWSNSVYQIAQTSYQTNGTSAIRTDTNSYDPLDRVTQTTGPTVAGTIATVQTLYNSLGLLVQQSLPFLSGATTYQQTYGFDVLNRPISVTRPISSTNSTLQSTGYAYAGRKTKITDPYGNTKTLITDVNGKLRETTDALGYTITRAYDAAGTLTGITDSASNTLLSNVAVAYGIKPFITAANDADLGAWTYSYDSLGERIGWTDAKGQSFSMTYDAQSRPVTRSEPDLTTTWTWGNSASSDNIGKLASVTAASILGTYQETYTFDGLSRPSSTVITIPGDQSYTYTKSYNAATGRLGTLTYPLSSSGYQLALNYTFTNGILSALTDASTQTVYWSANASNARGQITEETLGNDVVTSRNFDAVTGWLGSIGAGVGAGSTALQNTAYLYDEMGNLVQQQDNNRGLTEDFYYDNDYRLSYSTLNGTQNLNLVYAANGNIAARTDVGDGAAWTYDPVRIHAVTQTGSGGYSFVYDANGNATSRNGYTNTWTSYNYPSGVNSAGEFASFYYGPNRQRIETIYSGSIGTETTYHVGQLLEKVANANGSGITDWRYYIKAGNELVGIYSTQAAAVHYTIGDHQGGIATLTSGGESCPAGYTLSGSTCTETLSQAATATYSCPAGYTLSGSSCVDAASTAATVTYSCPAGYSLSGTSCSETVTAAATVSYSCPSGYTLSGTNCAETSEEPATRACAIGAVASPSASHTPAPAVQQCPVGETLSYTCPAGWTLQGADCSKTTTQAATATYSCPAGYALSGTTCSETLTQAATASDSCPAGYSLSGSTCVETLTLSATVSYSCPAGYTLTGTTCSDTLTVAASGSGAGVLVAESFTAYGNRRSGENWSGAPSSTDETSINGVSRWGYTGQTALGVSMGLNHMNGRVEDAILGRFLSPDPHITDPSNAQSYNRYSYVGNNPLTLIDPSGFEYESPTCGGDPCGSGGSGDGGDGGDGGAAGAGSPGLIDPGPIVLPPTPTLPPTAPATPPTYTGSMIPGNAPGNLYCVGCAGSSGSGTDGTTGTSSTAGDGGAAAGGMTTQAGGSAQSAAQSGAQPDPNAPQSTAPDNSLQITVTSQSTAQNGSSFAQGPLLAQEAPFVDPFLEAIRTRPVSPDEFGKPPQYTPRIGVPDPLPEPAPQNFWYQLFNLFKSVGSYIDNIFGIAPPVCPTCIPA